MVSSSARSAFRLSLPEGLVAEVIFSRTASFENRISYCRDDNRDTTYKFNLHDIDLGLESLLLRVISTLVRSP